MSVSLCSSVKEMSVSVTWAVFVQVEQVKNHVVSCSKGTFVLNINTLNANIS